MDVLFGDFVVGRVEPIQSIKLPQIFQAEYLRCWNDFSRADRFLEMPFLNKKAYVIL